MAKGKKANDSVGRVRMFEVLTPNEKFSGIREKVKFQDGRAELPEPRPVDFFQAPDLLSTISAADSIDKTQIDTREGFFRQYPGLGEYIAERDAFRIKMRRYKESGYRIRVREVEVMPERPYEDVQFEG